MPYRMETDNEGCPAERPIAVINEEDEEVVGCHPDEESAQHQIDMLMEREHEDDEEAAAVERPWLAPVLAREGEAACDGRVFIDLSWRDLPLSLMWQQENRPGHEGAVVVGRIDEITKEGSVLSARGVLSPAPEHVDVIRQVEERILRGVSIDAAPTQGASVEMEEDGDQFDGVLMTLRGFQIAGATLVPIPAFADAEVMLEDVEQVAASVTALPSPRGTADTEEGAVHGGDTFAQVVASLVAHAGPSADSPPIAWFTAPDVDRRRGMHIEADGRIWGHIYGWGECHLGSPPGQCVTVPRGTTARGMFAGLDGRGVLTREGETISTGPICLASDHADLSLSWLAAKDHYAHSALAVADVACGEDDYGIWVAGMVRPGTPPELVHALRASGPSGDWRGVGGRLELVAILAVSLQGFPALAASIDGCTGEITALVASGASIDEPGCACGTNASSEDREALRAEVERLRAFIEPLRLRELAERDQRMTAQRERWLTERDARILA